jgi:hypothetical protein
VTRDSADMAHAMSARLATAVMARVMDSLCQEEGVQSLGIGASQKIRAKRWLGVRVLSAVSLLAGVGLVVWDGLQRIQFG